MPQLRRGEEEENKCVCVCVCLLAVGRCENLILSVHNGTSPKSNKQTKRLLQKRCKDEDCGGGNPRGGVAEGLQGQVFKPFALMNAVAHF